MILANLISLNILVLIPLIASFYYKFNRIDHIIIWASCILALYAFYGFVLIPLVVVIFREHCSTTFYKHKKHKD